MVTAQAVIEVIDASAGQIRQFFVSQQSPEYDHGDQGGFL